ncbi:hypothetical protein VNO77_31839 [Canavalia gladiata]|uniref:Uncharacterized protein n=1 Tax=Canavalia gladiata TaxID=3824 RepID=A0AAN9Q7X3_CANGL
MGGCASKPKDLDLKQVDAPSEAPTIKEAEGEVVAVQEDNKEGGKSDSEEKEEPLVDLFEPKEKTQQPFQSAFVQSVEQPSEVPVSAKKSLE